MRLVTLVKSSGQLTWGARVTLCVTTDILIVKCDTRGKKACENVHEERDPLDIFILPWKTSRPF